MTNVQIIEAAKAELIAEGKMKPEQEIHTYNHWKKLGYQVFRGEKAVISLNIWKGVSSKKDDDEEDEEKKPKRMMMKRAYFFTTEQVFAIE